MLLLYEWLDIESFISNFSPNSNQFIPVELSESGPVWFVESETVIRNTHFKGK